jgi:hypothetical protein
MNWRAIQAKKERPNSKINIINKITKKFKMLKGW